ncbi:MAG: DUF983 domain-containing protein [Chitinophagales bacterium]
MAFSDTRFGIVASGRCPRCGKGKLFIDPNPYHLSNMGKMHKTCSNCHLKFEPETGFYYGAMYLSYLIGVFSSLLVFSIFHFIVQLDVLWSFILVALIWIGISPYLFRFSRSLWLSLFVRNHRDI